MKKPNVDELLKSYAEKPVPPLPSNFEDAVWREIRLRRQIPVHESFFNWLAACVWREHSAAAFVVAAMVFGAGLAWLGQNASAAHPISRALSLQVFSEQPPTLRLTTLYRQP
jgi:hypothetical protein